MSFISHSTFIYSSFVSKLENMRFSPSFHFIHLLHRFQIKNLETRFDEISFQILRNYGINEKIRNGKVLSVVRSCVITFLSDACDNPLGFLSVAEINDGKVRHEHRRGMWTHSYATNAKSFHYFISDCSVRQVEDYRSGSVVLRPGCAVRS